jgi:hypothetical protein
MKSMKILQNLKAEKILTSSISEKEIFNLSMQD